MMEEQPGTIPDYLLFEKAIACATLYQRDMLDAFY
jgi:hypothetical protein